MATPAPPAPPAPTGPAAPTPRTSPARRRTTSNRRGRALFVAGCVVPAFVLVTIFMVVPTANVFRLSLYQWTGLSGAPRFVGLENFEALLRDQAFLRAFQNSVLVLVVVTVVTLALGLVLAGVMVDPRLKGRSLYRFVLYLPSVLSIVVVAAVFAAIYDQQNGLINGTLYALGLDGLAHLWLGDEKTIMYSIAIAMVWQSVGYYLVLYMAAISAVPPEFYEASQLDGAGRVRQFVEITIPLVWPTIRTTLTFFVLSSVNLSFVLIRALTDGGPNGSSEVLLGYMYRQAYTNTQYGYGMAIGTVIFTFSFLVAVLVGRASQREDHQY